MSKIKANTLRGVGLKNTQARRLVLGVFSVNCKPLDAKNICKKLSGKINPVTVYRTLTVLEKSGFIRRVGLRKSSVHYERAHHHHHHLICTLCGTTEDFERCNIDLISKDVLKNSSTFKTVSEHSFELFGLCKSCHKG